MKRKQTKITDLLAMPGDIIEFEPCLLNQKPSLERMQELEESLSESVSLDDQPRIETDNK